jgi:hypothetical protein
MAVVIAVPNPRGPCCSPPCRTRTRRTCQSRCEADPTHGRSPPVRIPTGHGFGPLRELPAYVADRELHVTAHAGRSQEPHPYPRRVRATQQGRPRSASAPGRDCHRDRHAVGGAHRAAPRHVDFLRQSLTVEENDHRGLQEALPHRRAVRDQALPQGQRAQDVRRPRRLARRTCPLHQGPPHRPRRPALHHHVRNTDLAQHLPHPRGSPQSRPAASTSMSASTTSATPTHPGCWPPAQASNPSWNEWDTRRSRRRRSTCMHYPKRTRRTWTPGRTSRHRRAGSRAP